MAALGRRLFYDPAGCRPGPKTSVQTCWAGLKGGLCTLLLPMTGRDIFVNKPNDIATAKAAAFEIVERAAKVVQTMSFIDLDESGKAIVRESVAGADAEITEKLDEVRDS